MAIGRALVRNPKVFLFDEPLSNLDAALRVQMRLELASLHDSLQATMIYVTHDQVEAMTLADKIVVLQGGIVEQVGSPLELYHHPCNLFVAGFIGSPKMNFLSVTVAAVNDSGTTVKLPGDATVTIPVKPRLSVGDRATLGIRPEHLRLDRNTSIPNRDLNTTTGPALDIVPRSREEHLLDSNENRYNATVNGEVLVVERLGGETYLYVKIAGGDTLIVQTDGDNPSQMHDIVPIRISGDLCHLFAQQGEAIPKNRRHHLTLNKSYEQQYQHRLSNQAE